MLDSLDAVSCAHYLQASYPVLHYIHSDANAVMVAAEQCSNKDMVHASIFITQLCQCSTARTG